MVRHFLKDGTEVESIEGFVIKKEDFKGLYNMIDRMNIRLAKERENNDNN